MLMQKSTQLAKEVIKEHMKAIERSNGKANLLTKNKLFFGSRQ